MAYILFRQTAETRDNPGGVDSYLHCVADRPGALKDLQRYLAKYLRKGIYACEFQILDTEYNKVKRFNVRNFTPSAYLEEYSGYGCNFYNNYAKEVNSQITDAEVINHFSFWEDYTVNLD